MNKEIAKEVLGVLKNARKLLIPKENWAQGGFAKNNTENVQPRSDNATSWCMIGALRKTIDNDYDPIYCKCLTVLSQSLPKSYNGLSVMGFNDRPQTTHRQILNLFNRAIKKIEKTLEK